MSSNETDGEPLTGEDCEKRETFHVYLLTFYSLLAVSVFVGGVG